MIQLFLTFLILFSLSSCLKKNSSEAPPPSSTNLSHTTTPTLILAPNAIPIVKPIVVISADDTKKLEKINETANAISKSLQDTIRKTNSSSSFLEPNYQKLLNDINTFSERASYIIGLANTIKDEELKKQGLEIAEEVSKNADSAKINIELALQQEQLKGSTTQKEKAAASAKISSLTETQETQQKILGLDKLEKEKINAKKLSDISSFFRFNKEYNPHTKDINKRESDVITNMIFPPYWKGNFQITQDDSYLKGYFSFLKGYLDTIKRHNKNRLEFSSYSLFASSTENNEFSSGPRIQNILFDKKYLKKDKPFPILLPMFGRSIVCIPAIQKYEGIDVTQDAKTGQFFVTLIDDAIYSKTQSISVPCSQQVEDRSSDPDYVNNHLKEKYGFNEAEKAKLERWFGRKAITARRIKEYDAMYNCAQYGAQGAPMNSDRICVLGWQDFYSKQVLYSSELVRDIVEIISKDFYYNNKKSDTLDPIKALEEGSFQCDMAAFIMMSVLRDLYDIPARIVVTAAARGVENQHSHQGLFVDLSQNLHARVEVFYRSSDGNSYDKELYDPTPIYLKPNSEL